MAKVIVGIGSNIGDRGTHLTGARKFLSELGEGAIRHSSIYLSEPVGPSERNFFNAAAEIETPLPPGELIRELKRYERDHGRPPDHPRWEARTIDLDLIAYDDLVIQEDNLIIPHPEYRQRLFVLLPLRELIPEWRDPQTEESIEELVRQASPLVIHKTELPW